MYTPRNLHPSSPVLTHSTHSSSTLLEAFSLLPGLSLSLSQQMGLVDHSNYSYKPGLPLPRPFS